MSRPFVGCARPSGWRCGTLRVMDNDPTPEQCEAIRAHFLSIAGGAVMLPPQATLEGLSPLERRLDALVSALQAQTAAIEALVAVAAASLPDEPPEPPDDGFPQPLSRPR